MLKIKGWETIIKRYVPEAMRMALIERFSCDPIELARHYVGVLASVMIKQRYSEGGRFYHNLKHIENCLMEFREVETKLSNPRVVVLALLFHDIIYNPQAKQPLANETASWEMAKQINTLNPEDHSAIMNHILYTSHQYTGDGDSDTDYICDIDMAILGYPEHQFEEYEHNIRREYAFASDEKYKAGRIQFLQTLLSSEYIFKTDYFKNKYEISARRNIKKLIRQLS
jgi:predicted metal-dependent HD superfamily phosphohydrolase